MQLRRNYFLLLADIKSSTSLAAEDRDRLFESIRMELGGLNTRFESALVRPLSLSYGDEVAGLFHSIEPIPNVIFELERAVMDFTSMRFVVAEGQVGNRSKDIRQIGGTVFKSASAAMQRIKKSKNHCVFVTNEEVRDAAIGACLNSRDFLLSNMTGYQREVYTSLKAGLSQKEIAEKMGKIPQSVSKAVKTGGSEIVIELEKAIFQLCKATTTN